MAVLCEETALCDKIVCSLFRTHLARNDVGLQQLSSCNVRKSDESMKWINAFSERNTYRQTEKERKLYLLT